MHCFPISAGKWSYSEKNNTEINNRVNLERVVPEVRGLGKVVAQEVSILQLGHGCSLIVRSPSTERWLDQHVLFFSLSSIHSPDSFTFRSAGHLEWFWVTFGFHNLTYRVRLLMECCYSPVYKPMCTCV